MLQESLVGLATISAEDGLKEQITLFTQKK